jgi:hypothetical protein
MKPIVEPNDDLQFSRILKRYLRALGEIVPTTPGEVAELLNNRPDLLEMKGSDEEAAQILRRGYSGFSLTRNADTAKENTSEFTRAAARNAGKITDEIRKKMDNDRNESFQ